MSRLYLPILLLSLISLAGCSYFRLPVLQGNIVDYEKAEQLKPGMTPKQVEFLLGTPLIQDSFGADRWDYVIYFRNQDAKVLHKNLSIYFEDDQVSRIEGLDVLLADWRKKKAVVKKVTEILENPHPGQPPSSADSLQDQPAEKPAPAKAKQKAEAEQDKAEKPASDEQALPPDMSTIYE